MKKRPGAAGADETPRAVPGANQPPSGRADAALGAPGGKPARADQRGPRPGAAQQSTDLPRGKTGAEEGDTFVARGAGKAVQCRQHGRVLWR